MSLVTLSERLDRIHAPTLRRWPCANLGPSLCSISCWRSSRPCPTRRRTESSPRCVGRRERTFGPRIGCASSKSSREGNGRREVTAKQKRRRASRRALTPEQIADLSMNAKNIAEFLTGRKISSHDRNFVVPCPAHDDTSPSLSLRDGDRGLMVHCFAGCAPADIYGAIRRRNHNLLEAGKTAPDPANSSSEYERRQRDKAGWLWSQRKRITGTVAERYLRQARGYPGPLPPTLAFLPARKPDQHPALIAAFALIDEPEPGRLGVPRGSCHTAAPRRSRQGRHKARKASYRFSWWSTHCGGPAQ